MDDIREFLSFLKFVGKILLCVILYFGSMCGVVMAVLGDFIYIISAIVAFIGFLILVKDL